MSSAAPTPARNKHRLHRIFRAAPAAISAKIAQREWNVSGDSITSEWINDLLAATANIPDLPTAVVKMPASTKDSTAAVTAAVAVDPEVAKSRQNRFGFVAPVTAAAAAVPPAAPTVAAAPPLTEEQKQAIEEARQRRLSRFGEVAPLNPPTTAKPASGAPAAASTAAAIEETEESRALKARRLERFGAAATASSAPAVVAVDAEVAKARASRFADPAAEARKQRFGA